MENKGEIWQDFIRTEIAPARLTTQRPGDADIASYIQRSAQVREGFIDDMIAGAIYPMGADQLNVLIAGYQGLLCFLLNHVHGYRQQSEMHPQLVRLYDAATNDLEAGLHFIQHYFPKHFDQTALVPGPLLEAFRKSIELKEADLADSPIGLEGDGAFYSLVFSELRSASAGPIRFEQLSYLTAFLQGLSGAGESGSLNPPPVPQLVEYCIVKNFNTGAVVRFCLALLTERLSGFEAGDEKREWLRSFHKYLNQLPVEQEHALQAHRAGVREYLVAWVEQELLAGQADQKKETVGAVESLPKINTSVSVPVLALLTRVFKESGVITNTNLQELFRSISAHYTSQRAESISPANFHGKYYTVEDATRRKVTDLLMEMIKVVRKIP